MNCHSIYATVSWSPGCANGGGVDVYDRESKQRSPSDPADLRDKSILGADIDWATGKLQCELSEDAAFTVTPAPQEEADDPPNWELFIPSGGMLEFGPGPRWQMIDETDL